MDAAGRTMPYPCAMRTDTGVQIAGSYDAPTGNRISPDEAAGITASSGGAAADLPALLAGRIEEFIMVEGRQMNVSTQRVAFHCI